MQTITFSPGLQQAVRQLKSFDSYEAVRMLKDTNWLKSFSLTREEEATVSNMFSQSKKASTNKVGTNDYWG